MLSLFPTTERFFSSTTDRTDWTNECPICVVCPLADGKRQIKIAALGSTK